MKILSKNRMIRAAIVVIALLCFTSVAYVLYLNSEEKPFTDSGKIDIGGYSLYIKSSGEGKPTVVFDSGYGMSYAQWYNVVNGLKGQTRTIMYSRAGITSSDKSPLARTSEVKAEELHKLLSATHIKGPYILVGHSLGGLNVRMFAAKYPKEVAGIILVDTSHEDQSEWAQNKLPEQEKNRYFEIEKDIAKQYNSPDGSYEDILKSREQIRSVRNAINDLPITVIVAQDSIENPENRTQGIWLDLQKDLAALSTKSKLIIAENSSHNVPEDKPEYVINAILDMLKELEK